MRSVGRRATILTTALFAACSPAERPPTVDGPPDLLLLTVDTVRADRAGCMGHPGGLTPALDRALRRGLLARHAFAPAPLTAVSHASMLTGTDPPTHGVRENGRVPLSDAFPTLASLLQERGWRTGAFIAALPLSHRFGFDCGFETYDDDLSAPPGPVPYFAQRSAARVVKPALAWAAEVEPDERMFLWGHFFDPHHPREVPPSLRSFPAASDYDREIRGMDYEIGKLLNQLAALRKRPRIVAVLSDHGEALGDHGESSHGILTYEETMRGWMGLALPALVDAPAPPSGFHLTVTRYADLLPTLLDALKIPTPDDLDGVSWFAGRASRGSEGVYGETYYPMQQYGWSPLLSWRDERWTYIESPAPELYDRSVDPGETANVIDRHPQIAADFAARLARQTREPAAVGVSPADEATREQLLALGYVAGSEPPVDRSKNPRDLVTVANLLFRGIHHLGRGQNASALAVLREADEQDPGNPSVVFYLANALRASGDLTAAEARYRDVLAQQPEMGAAWAHLALLVDIKGDREGAFVLLEEGLRNAPNAVPLLLSAGDLHLAAGNLEAAAEFFERARQEDPQNADLKAALARLAAQRRGAGVTH